MVEGGWPPEGSDTDVQHLKQPISAEVVTRLAPDEKSLILLPPPFRSLADEISCNGAFRREFGALDEIDPDEAILIADFGIGSDAVMVADFRTQPPRILRLAWRQPANQWIVVARSIDELVAVIASR